MTNYINYKDIPIAYTGQIRIFDAEAFEKMHIIGQLTATCLDDLADFIKPGITTKQIDNFVYNFAQKNNILPATLNYRGYAHSCCTSINHVVCHGIPNNRPLQEGDIINVDVTFIKEGWHGDSSRMYPVGKVKRTAERLMEVTHESLMRAIKAIKPGIKLGTIGHIIQTYAESERCSVVRDFCGHGIGQLFHDAPNVLHYGEENTGVELKEGMIFTIEPMINLGKYGVKILADGWTAVTRDRSLTAQYEHTIGVTQDGCEIFTSSPKNIFYLPAKSLFNN